MQNPDQRLNPEIYNLKKFIEVLKNEGRILNFIDVHSNQYRKGAFMYGPSFPIHKGEYYEVKLLPKVMGECTDTFRYFSC